MQASSPSALHPANLGWPFAVIGFLGAWTTADSFELGPAQAPIRALLLLITPIAAGALGSYLATTDARVRRGAEPPDRPIATFLGATFTAGVLNGAVIGYLFLFPVGMIFGALYGAFCTLPFLPLLGLLRWTATAVGEARPGSLIDLAARRRVWLVTALLSLVVSVVPRAARPASLAISGEGALVVALVALIVMLGVLGADVRALEVAAARAKPRVCKGTRGGERLERSARFDATVPGAPGFGPVPDGTHVVDFGVGETTTLEVDAVGHAYRGMGRVRAAYVGDAARAWATMRTSVLLDAGATLVAVGFGALACARILFEGRLLGD